MKLAELIHDAPGLLAADGDPEISDIVYDSRQVGAGALFVAMPGLHVHGSAFIPAAIEAGAAAVVHDGDQAYPGAVNVRVLDVRSFLGHAAHRFFGDPSAKMTVVGVTGTNGKTTVTYLLESIFAAAGSKVGVIGTVNYRFAGTTLPAPNTTPLAVDLARVMRRMRDAGVDTVVTEVSSHALDQQRVRGVRFDAACFTNLSRDHLDYHRDLADYFETKKLLFTRYLPDSGKANRVASVNLDDPRGVELAGQCGRGLITFGQTEGTDVRLAEPRVDLKGLRGRLVSPHGTFEITSPLLGDFSVSNVLAAASVSLGLGVAPDRIRVGIERLRRVPGRLDPVGSGDVRVLVDYAHTPEALTNVLDSLTRLVKGRIITVFGCGGDRDEGKRPLMGQAVAEQSHISVVTSDNPRTEDPDAIIKQILPGMEPLGPERIDPEALADFSGVHGLIVQPDRRRAIALAIQGARPGDVVLIAGKGHEDYQILGTTKHPFDDRVEARKVLEQGS